jgi:hypothetical protein
VSANSAFDAAVPAPADIERATGPVQVEWVRRYEMRFIEGAFPAQWHGENQGSPRSRLGVRDDPPRPLDFASLIVQLWNEAGELLVTPHQVVYYKE